MLTRKEKVINKLISAPEFERKYGATKTKDRSKVKICFLDDEGYTSVDKLNSLGYKNIEVKFEFNNLEEFSDYDVIFCDIQGVGKSLYPKFQGYDVAIELSKMYPNCNVFIYTGKDLSQYPPLPKNIKCISKQTSMKEIVSILDNECEYLWNPIAAWEKYELELRNKKTDNKFIALIEDKFFSSIINGKNEMSENYFSSNVSFYNEIKFYITTLISLIDIILRFQGR